MVTRAEMEAGGGRGMAEMVSKGPMRVLLALRMLTPLPLRDPHPAGAAEAAAAAGAVDVIPAADLSSSPPRPPAPPLAATC